MAKKNCTRRSSADHKLVEIPGLGLFNGQVSAMDTIVGVGAGAAGGLGLKYALNSSGMAANLPDLVNRFWPLVGATATGALMYALQKKKNAARAKAHFVGAVAGGVGATIWDTARSQFPQLADLVSVRLNQYHGSPYGVLVNDQPGRLAAHGYGGVIVNDTSSNLAQLNALNMTPDDDE